MIVCNLNKFLLFFYVSMIIYSKNINLKINLTEISFNVDFLLYYYCQRRMLDGC